MAYITVTTDVDFIYVEFNDLWDGKRVSERSMKIRKSQIIEVTKKEYIDGTGVVNIDVMHHNDSWNCCIPTEIKSWTYPVDSVNGIVTDTLDKLFVELEKIM